MVHTPALRARADIVARRLDRQAAFQAEQKAKRRPRRKLKGGKPRDSGLRTGLALRLHERLARSRRVAAGGNERPPDTRHSVQPAKITLAELDDIHGVDREARAVEKFNRQRLTAFWLELRRAELATDH